MIYYIAFVNTMSSNIPDIAHDIVYDIRNDIANWGCPADLLTNQTVLDPKVHCHTSRAPQVGIEPTSSATEVVALPTKPQIPIRTGDLSRFRPETRKILLTETQQD